jgi:hypothetical protein
MRNNSRRGYDSDKMTDIYISFKYRTCLYFWLFLGDVKDFFTRFELGVYFGTDRIAIIFWGDWFHCYTTEKLLFWKVLR